jgi:hypothetical protein
LFIGVLNRYAIKGVERRVRGMFTPSIYNHARFFSVWQLKHMIYDLVGPVPIAWRTVCQLPLPSGKFAHSFEQPLLQRCPFGAFAGMVVILVPRVRTRPLTCATDPDSPGRYRGKKLRVTELRGVNGAVGTEVALRAVHNPTAAEGPFACNGNL